MPGDVIYAINGQLLEDLQGLRTYLGKQPRGTSLAIQVLREGSLYFVAFETE